MAKGIRETRRCSCGNGCDACEQRGYHYVDEDVDDSEPEPANNDAGNMFRALVGLGPIQESDTKEEERQHSSRCMCRECYPPSDSELMNGGNT